MTIRKQYASGEMVIQLVLLLLSVSLSVFIDNLFK